MRGFLSGMVWGGAAIGVGLTALSLMSPVAPRPELKSDAPETAVAVGTPEASGITPGGRDPDLVEAAPSALAEAGPERDGLEELAEGTQPGKAPNVVREPDRPQAPEPAAGAQGPQDTPETAAITGAAPQAPQAPSADPAAAAPAAEQTPRPQAQDSAEVPSESPAGQSPAAPQATEAPEPQGQTPQLAAQSTPEAAPEAETASDPAPEVSPDDPVALGDSAAAPAPEAPASAPAPTVADAPAAIPEPEGADAPAQVQVASDPPPRREAAPAPEPGATQEAPQVAALPQNGTAPQAAEETPDVRPGIGQRVVPLTERGKPEAAAPATAPDNSDVPPLSRFAQGFENPEGKPLMAIVLIDDAEAIGIEALAEFPYPLTFALDPTAPDAAEKMARHRDAGFEVVALIDLPRGAAPQDAEVALSAGFDRLPEALAVMEGSGTGVQGSRPLSDQVTDFAGSTGRGLITLGNGLNTVQKLAVRGGVPAAAVFRDFDGAGQTPTVMRRFLDQAAFRAGQEGAVVMLGRVRPDTVSSLLIWALQDRVNRVAMAPVSAVLKASVGGE